MIIVVLYCFMVDDWEIRLSGQLKRMKSSSLYEESNEIHLVVTDINNNQKDKIDSLLSEYQKIRLDYTTRNWYEGHALSKVDNIARTYDDCKILYFHTKGVSNKYKDLISNDYYNLKVEGIKCWKELMEYFLIDNWKDCIKKLDEYDTVGVNNVNNWWWGNFWWSNSKHIKNNKPFNEYFTGSRWGCESWLHESNYNIENIKYYQFYPFNYDPYYSILPKYFYDGTNISDIKIKVLDAKFGYFAEQRDEGRGLSENKDNVIDVTNKTIELLKLSDNKEFNFNPNDLLIDNHQYHGNDKSIRILFKTNIDPEKTYTLTSFYLNKLKH
jgi:hypothetical protein